MTSPWTYGLIAIALVTMALSYRVPRAWLWIGCGGLSFFASTLFYDYYGMPQWHAPITFLCDTMVCVAIFNFYEEDWELGIFIAFLCSTSCSMLMLAGAIPEQWVYASLLEVCNLGALLWIGTMGIIEMIGRHEDSYFHSLRNHLHHARDHAGHNGS